jgi:CRISPR-associated protein Cmr2
MSERFFHFTLGPVQSFVAQARRTRDFWAGSFLLSFLSAVAMTAVRKQGGSIRFPKADEGFLACLEGKPEDDQKVPTQGLVPNRFKALVKDGFDPDRVVESVKTAWFELAELVWKRDLAEVVEKGSHLETREIWQGQVRCFWDVNWALTDDEGDADVIERRKYWRTLMPSAQGGTKCLIMDGWQELSGVAAPDSAAQERFWGAVRTKIRSFDLREGEHLCAMALIKRRFARHFSRLEVRMPGGWTLKGWTLPTEVPSVPYMAAAPWLAQVVRTVDERALLGFWEVAQKLKAGSEKPVRCVRDAKEKSGKAVDGFLELSGDLFFEESLDNPRQYPDQSQASRVKRALQDLRALSELGCPSPFYAILLMDGDSLGQHMRKLEKQRPISDALERFTRRVPEIVDQHSGFLVYAGGDDVLALLTLDEALGCAQSLREHYRASFAGTGIDSTLSGAIEYAHCRVPLARVLADAHELLDVLAKDSRGRDAIAVRVWTPGGKTIEWAMPWEKALEKHPSSPPEGTSPALRIVLEVLAEELRNVSGEAVFSSRFFYRIREIFELLNPPRSEETGGLEPDQARELVTAEYRDSGIHENERPTLEKAREVVSRLLGQCRPVKRTLADDLNPAPPDQWKLSPRLEADGALLARFLARKGVD